MNLTKRTLVVALAVAFAMPGTTAVGFAQRDQNRQSSAKAKARNIRGVWRTVVTPQNCQTGEQFPSLQGLFTFNQGGTMSEYGIGPGSSPALRSPGHGAWQREHGWHEYSFAFTFYRYNASGVLLGSQKVTAALELSGDEFFSRSAITVLDANDRVIGTGCATAVGTRFE